MQPNSRLMGIQLKIRTSSLCAWRQEGEKGSKRENKKEKDWEG